MKNTRDFLQFGVARLYGMCYISSMSVRLLPSVCEAAMSDTVRALVNAALLFGAINPEVGLEFARMAFQEVNKAQRPEVVS
jgi:hypothetical protein